MWFSFTKLIREIKIAASAPKPPFPGPGAAHVGAPVEASSTVAAPLRVGPEAVLVLVSLRLALGYRFGS